MGEPESFSRKEIISRIGTFFLIVGVGLFLLFLLSESTGKISFEYLCGSTILVTLGFIFRAQYKKGGPSSGRFGLFKRFRRKKDE
ncbi:MAG TPA: hypothetical protein VMJ90_03280 [Anaerolineales bacterium]|nr:hypothetical protein [Anaerolineales bacterium]